AGVRSGTRPMLCWPKRRGTPISSRRVCGVRSQLIGTGRAVIGEQDVITRVTRCPTPVDGGHWAGTGGRRPPGASHPHRWHAGTPRARERDRSHAVAHSKRYAWGTPRAVSVLHATKRPAGQEQLGGARHVPESPPRREAVKQDADQ